MRISTLGTVVPLWQSSFLLLTWFKMCLPPAETYRAGVSRATLPAVCRSGIDCFWLSSAQGGESPAKGRDRGGQAGFCFSACQASASLVSFLSRSCSCQSALEVKCLLHPPGRAFAVKVLTGISSTREMKCNTTANRSRKDEKRCWFLFSGISVDFALIV